MDLEEEEEEAAVFVVVGDSVEPELAGFIPDNAFFQVSTPALVFFSTFFFTLSAFDFQPSRA